VSAREEVLAAVRSALGPDHQAAPEVPRGYRAARLVPAGAPELVKLFCERVADYKAEVHRVSGTDELQAALADVCTARGSSRVLRAPAADWDIDGAEVRPDSPDLSAQDLDSVDAALTGCALAIAETGTIVLDGGALSGRRALTLYRSACRRRPRRAPTHVRLWPVRDLGYRAPARRGSARAANARRGDCVICDRRRACQHAQAGVVWGTAQSGVCDDAEAG